MSDAMLSPIGLYVTVYVRRQFKYDGRLHKRGKTIRLPNAVAERFIATGRAMVCQSGPLAEHWRDQQ
jgi:hypothetical protein